MTSAALGGRWAEPAVSKGTSYDGSHQGVVSAVFLSKLLFHVVLKPLPRLKMDSFERKSSFVFSDLTLLKTFNPASVSDTHEGRVGLLESCCGLPALTAVWHCVTAAVILQFLIIRSR